MPTLCFMSGRGCRGCRSCRTGSCSATKPRERSREEQSPNTRRGEVPCLKPVWLVNSAEVIPICLQRNNRVVLSRINSFLMPFPMDCDWPKESEPHDGIENRGFAIWDRLPMMMMMRKKDLLVTRSAVADWETRNASMARVKRPHRKSATRNMSRHPAIGRSSMVRSNMPLLH